MTMSDYERVVLDKHQAVQVAEARLGLIGAIALNHGKEKKKGVVEYRMPKSKVERINGHRVELDTLKNGVTVVRVTEVEE